MGIAAAPITRSKWNVKNDQGQTDERVVIDLLMDDESLSTMQ